MKNHIFLLIIVCTTLNCKSQNIVAYNSDARKLVPNSGNYYKDTNNDFDKFVGEWKWEDALSNSELILLLQKVENISSERGFTYDLLKGEYFYKENGHILANTLLSIDDPNIVETLHNISGITLLSKYSFPDCTECSESEKRIKVTIRNDSFNNVTAYGILRKYLEAGVEKIKLIIIDGYHISPDPNAPENIDIPFGEYILIKQ